jgi:hypothetical protein
VDYNAKNEYEYINNYKVLQEVFTKQGIEKVRWLRGPLQDMQSKCLARAACVIWQLEGQLTLTGEGWESCVVRDS